MTKHYAVCLFCGKEMRPGTACIPFERMGDGTVAKRIPYDGWAGAHCPDCNAGRDKPHHAGCDQETCPGCGGQAFGCECYMTEQEKAEFTKELAKMKMGEWKDYYPDDAGKQGDRIGEETGDERS